MRLLSAAGVALGGAALAGMLLLITAMFSLWGTGPDRTDALVCGAILLSGFGLAAVMANQTLRQRPPALFVSDATAVLRHPDLAAPLVIPRSAVRCVDVEPERPVPAALPRVVLSLTAPPNVVFVFEHPVPNARSRVLSQLPPGPAGLPRGGELRGLAVAVIDARRARAALARWAEFRRPQPEDFLAAGVDPRPGLPPQAVGILILGAVAMLMIFRFVTGWN